MTKATTTLITAVSSRAWHLQNGGTCRSDLNASIVLAADDPAALARFYARLLQCEAQPGLGIGHWLVPWPAGGHLEIYAPSRARPQPRHSGRLALCLRRHAPTAAERLDLLDAWVREACGSGALPADPARVEPFGAEAWLLDPEGNRLLLLVS